MLNEIGVGSMNFDSIITGFDCSSCCFTEIPDNRFYFVFSECTWNGFSFPFGRNITCADHFSIWREILRYLSTSMKDL